MAILKWTQYSFDIVSFQIVIVILGNKTDLEARRQVDQVTLCVLLQLFVLHKCKMYRKNDENYVRADLLKIILLGEDN